jgi:hypothetical protein
MTAKAAYRAGDALAGLSTYRDSHSRRRTLELMQLTPLNIATTARYRACLATGGHERSGREIGRFLGSVNAEVRFHVCARCDVPFMRNAVLGLNNKPVLV